MIINYIYINPVTVKLLIFIATTEYRATFEDGYHIFSGSFGLAGVITEQNEPPNITV